MIKVITSCVSFTLLLTLIACAQTPATITLETLTPISASPTPWAEGTAAALASPTPWFAGTETALAVPTGGPLDPNVIPSATPFPGEKPADFSPVLYGGKVYQSTFFLLLGGVSQETWLAPDISVSRFSGETTYSLHSFAQEAKYFLWGKSPEFSPTCQSYLVNTDAALEEPGFVGVIDGWQITKRPVNELSTDGIYQQALTDWLTTEEVSDPQVDSIHVYRVDLEGDGTDEVFISATHLDGSQHTTKAGDYSVILMRQVVGNEAVTRLVAGDLYQSQNPEITFPRTYSLTNFIDLNQDGILEVVVEIQKWEGYGALVFQIDDGDVIQALGAEC